MESNVEILCINKEKELLNKYFPKGFGRIESETIGDYTKDLPLKIEAEYREFLVELWKQFSDSPLVLEEHKLRGFMTKNVGETVEAAYRDASQITLWKRLTKSNYRDVTYYKDTV